MDSNLASDRLDAYADSIRQAPLPSVGIAFAVGLLFKILPITAIVGLLLRTALMLVRPALFALGVAKASELLRRRSSGGS